jgi:hypothetical protein
MSIEEEEKEQAKGIENIFIKITAEKFSTLETQMIIQVQVAFRTPKKTQPEKKLPMS